MGKVIKKFRAGQISATVWSNEREFDGEKKEVLSIQLTKSYKEKGADEWKETNNYNATDTPKAVLVLNKAYEFISVKEENPKQE